MQTLRAGVAGAGAMGRNHARIYSLLGNAELTAVYDADPARAQAIAQEFGGCPMSSLGEFAAACDLASVAVPTEAHRDIGCQLMELGLHVLMEKPIAPTVEDAQHLVDAAQRFGRVLQVGHVERFNPVMRELEKKLTRPRFIEAHRLSPFPNRSIDIGVVLDLMIHDLEIILHLVRSPIQTIDAVGVSVLTANEDIANARLRFENGCVANVTASRISPDRMRKLRVFQEDCYLSLDYQDQSGHVHWKEGMEIKRASVDVEPGEPLKLELEAFVNSAAAGAAPAVSGQQGTAALDVALQVTRKVRESFA
jgi:predicted dehydrogenase